MLDARVLSMTDDEIRQLQIDLDLVKLRNRAVEANKAWEVSNVRIGAICFITYVCAALLLKVIGVERWWIDATVPVVGFFLSTRSLRFLKRWWIAQRFS